MDVIQSHKDLLVWRKAVALASKVYAATGSEPSRAESALSDSLRRAAVTVATHIAEGSASRAECLRLLQGARASLCELETRVMIALDLQLICDSRLIEDIAHVSRLLNAHIRRTASAARIAHASACTPAAYSRPSTSSASNRYLMS